MAIAGMAQTVPGNKRPEQPPLVVKSVVGEELYRFYCANCHGLELKGRPARSAAHPAAPDLTVLSLQNDGRFPRERVHETIAQGAAVAAHRTGDMPVWGWVFRGLDPSEALVDVRISNLVQYIESMQAP
jgi:mono/diheme cytochrome c family protein